MRVLPFAKECIGCFLRRSKWGAAPMRLAMSLVYALLWKPLNYEPSLSTPLKGCFSVERVTFSNFETGARAHAKPVEAREPDPRTASRVCRSLSALGPWTQERLLAGACCVLAFQHTRCV